MGTGRVRPAAGTVALGIALALGAPPAAGAPGSDGARPAGAVAVHPVRADAEVSRGERRSQGRAPRLAAGDGRVALLRVAVPRPRQPPRRATLRVWATGASPGGVTLRRTAGPGTSVRPTGGRDPGSWGGRSRSGADRCGAAGSSST